MPEKLIFDTMGRKGIRIPSGMLEGVQARIAAEQQNWQQYLSFTPKDGGEYYTLSIPVGVEPPVEGEKMVLDGMKVVVSFISTPEEIAKGRGGPVARSMRENGIAYRVNCLPEGHEWLQKKTGSVKASKTAADRLLFPGQEQQEFDPSHNYKLASETVGKCKVILPPEKFDLQAERKMSVFLAGAIDMGSAEDWQKEITEYLSDVDCVVLNPRRKDWDSTWKQEMENPQFNEQVSWELKGLEEVNLIALCYTKDSKAPISLLEMGLHIGDGRLIVFCPEGYWRKGNVDIVCQRYGVPVLADWTDFKKEVHRRMLVPSTVIPKPVPEKFVMASDRMAWRVLAREFVMQMHTASKIKVGDICDVDMDEVNDQISEDVQGPWIRKIFLMAQKGNVRVNRINGDMALCVPESFSGTGGIDIPVSALKVVKTSATVLKEGDICTVDMNAAKSFGGLGANQINILKKVVKEGGGKVIITKIGHPPSGMSEGAAEVRSYNNPVAFMLGGVSVPWRILKVVGRGAGYVPIKTVSEKKEEERRRKETTPTHIPKKATSGKSDNHRDFTTKKEALKFLDDHALMSVGWKEGDKEKVAIYWNGKVHISDAKTKKYWGSDRVADEVDPMAGEKLTKLVMQFDRWTETLLDERPMSSPVSVQIMEGRLALRKKLQGKMGLTGTAAVKAMADAMRKNFTFDAAPFPSLVRKYGREKIYDIFHSLTGGMGDTHPFGSSPLSRRPDYGVRDGEISETHGLKLPSEDIMTSSDNMRVRVIADRITASAKTMGIE